MSHSTHVHLMAPDVHVDFEQGGPHRVVAVTSEDVRLSIVLADPASPSDRGALADALAFAEQLEAVAASIRSTFARRQPRTADDGDHHVYESAVA